MHTLKLKIQPVAGALFMHFSQLPIRTVGPLGHYFASPCDFWVWMEGRGDVIGGIGGTEVKAGWIHE